MSGGLAGWLASIVMKRNDQMLVAFAGAVIVLAVVNLIFGRK